jgi:hypothetical protein
MALQIAAPNLHYWRASNSPSKRGSQLFFIFFISFLVDDYQLSCHEVFDEVGGGGI